MRAENKALHPTVNDAMTRVGLATTLKKQLEQPPVKPVSTRASVAFQSVIPFGADGLANLRRALDRNAGKGYLAPAVADEVQRYFTATNLSPEEKRQLKQSIVRALSVDP